MWYNKKQLTPLGVNCFLHLYVNLKFGMRINQIDD